MPRRSKAKALLDRADRLTRSELPEVFLLVGAPEAVRLYPGRMNAEREAVLGGEYFAALDGETTKICCYRPVARREGGDGRRSDAAIALQSRWEPRPLGRSPDNR
jgi:hypothetical protein